MPHEIVSQDEWLALRKQLLVREKELTRLRDRLAAERRALPWVKVEKPYVFDGPDGKETLADLFRGRSQLIVKHFMFGPGWSEGCVGCSFELDHIDGILVHLAQRDVSYVAVARAPLPEIEAFKQRMGWRIKWVSSAGGDFNFDFTASISEEQQREGVEYNYRREPAWQKAKSIGEWRGAEPPVATMAAMTGTDETTYTRERPGMSAFALEDGLVYHTYSTYSRGVDALWGMYQWLDRSPKGRNETGVWWKRHDEYGN